MIARPAARTSRFVLAASALAFGVVTAAGLAVAQPAPAGKKDAAPAAKGAAPAAKGKAADAKGDDGKQAENKIPWVKLCEKQKVRKKAADGKDEESERNVCATMHERIDPRAGVISLSAKLLEAEGEANPIFQVTVPLGMIIPVGVKLTLLTQAEAEKLSKEDKVDPKSLRQVDMKFNTCLPHGCIAEIEANKEFMDKIGGVDIIAVSALEFDGRQYHAPVPLRGFADTRSGKPADNAEYTKAKREMLVELDKRRTEAIQKARAEHEKKKADQMKLLPAPPGGAAAAPATKQAAPKAETTKK